MYDFLPLAEHQAAEAAARRELHRMGFDVEHDGTGVVVKGAGFTLRARAARLILRDLDPLDGGSRPA